MASRMLMMSTRFATRLHSFIWPLGSYPINHFNGVSTLDRVALFDFLKGASLSIFLSKIFNLCLDQATKTIMTILHNWTYLVMV